MDCDKCGTQLRKIEQRWSETMTNMLERKVTCDVIRGGCGNTFWYEKQYTAITRHMATKQILTMTKAEPIPTVRHYKFGKGYITKEEFNMCHRKRVALGLTKATDEDNLDEIRIEFAKEIAEQALKVKT